MSLDLPSQNIPSLHFWPLHCGRTGAGQQQEESRGQGLALSAASLSRRAGALELSVLEPFLVLLPPFSRSGAPRFPWGCRPWRWGAQNECKKQLRGPCSPLPPPAHPLGKTLGWAEPHPCFPRCARYTSWSGASGKSSFSGQNHIGLSEIQCPQRQGWEHRAQCRLLKGLQGPFLPWRKVTEGRDLLNPGPSLRGTRTTVGRLALGGQEITSLLGPVPSEAARIPQYHRDFSNLGIFVSSWRTMIFNP